MSIIATMFILHSILSGANGAADIGRFNISDHVKPQLDLTDVETFPSKPVRSRTIMHEVEMKLRGARLLMHSA